MSYPPPPDQQQYTSLYPVATSEQLLGASHTEQVSYNVATTQAALQQFEQELGDGSFGADPSRNDAAALIESNNRANRLRKACDSCSIRKVKVSAGPRRETRPGRVPVMSCR